MLESIPMWFWGALLVIGVLGLLFKNKISQMVGGVGSIFGLKVNTTLMIISVLAVFMGGFGAVTGWFGALDLGTATVVDTSATTETVGLLTVKLHDGVVNATTTSDHVNDAEDVMTFYVTDANIDDGEEIYFNVTLERDNVVDATSITVTCTIPDKEISGVTADNIAEKTSGKIDLDINDGGRFVDDNTVTKEVTMSAGTGSAEVQIAFDQEETWEDGMTAYDTTATVECEAEGVPFTAVIYASD